MTLKIIHKILFLQLTLLSSYAERGKLTAKPLYQLQPQVIQSGPDTFVKINEVTEAIVSAARCTFKELLFRQAGIMHFINLYEW